MKIINRIKGLPEWATYTYMPDESSIVIQGDDTDNYITISFESEYIDDESYKQEMDLVQGITALLEGGNDE